MPAQSALAHYDPETVDQLDGIPGIGEKKCAEFGALVTAEIATCVRTNSRIVFT